MNYIEHLLTCTAEECGEVAKEIHKALRFGLKNQVTLDPNGPRGTTGPTNQDKIVNELNDLMALIEMLVIQEVLPKDWQDLESQKRKRAKVIAYMTYAQRVGTLA